MEGSGGGLAWRDSGRFRRRVSLELRVSGRFRRGVSLEG